MKLIKQSNKMTNLKQGDKVRNLYGETLTVLEVKGSSIRVYEEYNNFYHVTKLIIK